ncbi:MAG: hypothetical protein PF541_18225 [Prolixibacteraceae bacterium]|jgi:hypothetical protein|nr:hypothetical protein [Prolixibacteraceae bacterium]
MYKLNPTNSHYLRAKLVCQIIFTTCWHYNVAYSYTDIVRYENTTMKEKRMKNTLLYSPIILISPFIIPSKLSAKTI